MSKAVLVMDMPEQVCEKCDLCYETEDNNYMCAGIGKEIPDGEKPGWCPIRPLPEKMKVCGRYPQPDGISPSYKLGWNDCLDAINAIMEEGKNHE